ncbi:Cytochrome b5 reductase 4 [Pleurostoma richardsiae]|uniref:Cytochrome b5 reductase 4 n=1 Tax=Pleurostoma richardsiae TaxID=41990 RepID=A0AA38S6P3_9PEZI|nr:Cytochrome b5 reductase 4 [Pleurostoma richardsiae]
MALLGLTLVVASVVFFCFTPSSWLPKILAIVRPDEQLPPPLAPPLITPPDDEDEPARFRRGGRAEDGPGKQNGISTAIETTAAAATSRSRAATSSKTDLDRTAMPPPPPPLSRRSDAPKLASPIIVAPNGDAGEQTTPKATPAAPSDSVPSFSLSEPAETGHRAPRPWQKTPAASGPSPVPSPVPPPSAAPGLMAPPPRPPSLAPVPSPPSLSAASSPAQRRLNPLPRRGPSAPSSLAPPPTHSTLPSSKQVTLPPGHSPLDWARLSADPSSDLRGLPAGTPYIRVTPAALRRQTGRKGKDAWMALGGKVYNVTPYVPFHPGGGPELMRGAGRDGTKLFGENHPWVNYETMLQACLVGILVDEDEAEGEMDKMD